MSFNLPKSLPYCGRQINLAGKGHAPGSALYLDNITGKTHEVFVAVVERTGPQYSLGRVNGNQAVGLIRVDHHVLNGSALARQGDVLLAGPLQYTQAGPRAHAAWPAPSNRNGGPNGAPRKPNRLRRHVGLIVEVAASGTYGFLMAENSGRRVFVAGGELRDGAQLRRGARVSFVEGDNGKGAAAFDVRPVS